MLRSFSDQRSLRNSPFSLYLLAYFHQTETINKDDVNFRKINITVTVSEQGYLSKSTHPMGHMPSKCLLFQNG